MNAERDEAAGTNRDQSRLPAGTDDLDPRAETGGALPSVSAEEAVQWTRSTAKLYALAVIEEVDAATVRYRMELAAIRRKYRDELSEPGAFRLLLKAAKVWEAESVRQRQQTDDELHQYRRHPDWEYATTRGPRKAFDNQPPDGDGWEPNVTRADPEAWERFDYHEEAYWRRRRTPARYAATSDTPERGGPR